MRFLNTLSKVLILVPITMLGFDLVKGWFVHAKLEIRPFKEWWLSLSPDTLDSGKSFLLKILSPKGVDTIMETAGPLVMIALPITIYLLYRITFALGIGRGGSDSFKYKSRH
ncbi:MAG: hypothetical protein OXT65_10350 [Alphaproteobacteria bacterium]|nr:hypothetical protein [Alphaproteobacteria bacterium]